MKQTLESFVSFCDDMMIANEALGNFTTLVDTTEKTIKIYKHKFANAKSEQEKLKIVKDMKKSIEHLESEISHTKIGFFDKSSFKKVAGVVGAIAVCILSVAASAKIPDKELACAVFAAGATASVFMGMGAAGTEDEDQVKSKLLNSLQDEKRDCDIIIKQLSSGPATEGFGSIKKKVKTFMKIHKENRRVNNEYKKIMSELIKPGTYKGNEDINFKNAVSQAKTSNLKTDHPKTYSILSKVANELCNGYNSECGKLSKDIGSTIKFGVNKSFCSDTTACMSIILLSPSIDDLDEAWDDLTDALDRVNNRIWDKYTDIDVDIDDIRYGIIVSIDFDK